MTRRLGRLSASPLLLLPLLLGIIACGDSAPETRTPAEAYTAFFERLESGDRTEALETLAPEGVLGDTFRGGSYFMTAEVVEEQIESRGGLDSIIIDEEAELPDEEVRVEGRLRFADGSEEPRRIIFFREGDRWVGRL